MLLNYTETRPSMFKIFYTLIEDKNDQFIDLAKMGEAIQSNHSLYNDMKIETLQVFREIFQSKPNSKEHFQIYSGPICLVSVIVNLEKAFLTEEKNPLSIVLLREVFFVLIEYFGENPEGKRLFEEDVKYSSLATALKETGILQTNEEAEILFDLLICLIVGDPEAYEPISEGNFSHSSLKSIQNPEVAPALLLALLPLVQQQLQLKYFSKFYNLIETSLYNKVEISKVGLVGVLIRDYKDVIVYDSTSQYQSNEGNLQICQDVIYNILETLSSLYLLPNEMKSLFGLIDSSGRSPPSLRLLNMIFNCTKTRTPDYISFDMSSSPFNCIYMKRVNSWPPPSGYTFTAWIKVIQYDDGSAPLELLSFTDDTDRTILSIQISSQTKRLSVCVSRNYDFDYEFLPDVWYHIALVQSKGRLTVQQPHLTLYVNGQMTKSEKASYPSVMSSGFSTNTDKIPNSLPYPSLSLWMGTRPSHQKKCPLMWNLGPSYFIEEPLDLPRINAMYNIGPRIASNYQGLLSKYYTTDAINNINLDIVGKVKENEGDKGHSIFDIEELTIPEERFLFSFHPQNVFFPFKKPEIDVNDFHIINDSQTDINNNVEYKRQFIFNSSITRFDPSDEEKIDLVVERCGELFGKPIIFSSHDISENLRKVGGIPIIFKMIDLCQVLNFSFFFFYSWKSLLFLVTVTS